MTFQVRYWLLASHLQCLSDISWSHKLKLYYSSGILNSQRNCPSWRQATIQNKQNSSNILIGPCKENLWQEIEFFWIWNKILLSFTSCLSSSRTFFVSFTKFCINFIVSLGYMEISNLLYNPLRNGKIAIEKRNNMIKM